MVALLTVGAFALTDLGNGSLPPAGMPEQSANLDPPLPVPPAEIELHEPSGEYEELAQFDSRGVRNLFLKDATHADAEQLRELYMESMEEAGWTLVREEDQAKRLESEYAIGAVLDQGGWRRRVHPRATGFRGLPRL
jgi:hypothetical protein